MQPYRRPEIPFLACTCCHPYLCPNSVQEEFAVTESRQTLTSTSASHRRPFHVGNLLSQDTSQNDAFRLGIHDRRAPASAGTVTCDPLAVQSQEGYSFPEFGTHFTDRFRMSSFPKYKEDTTTNYGMSKDAKQPVLVDKPGPAFLVPKRVRTMFTMEQLDRLENEFSRRQYVTGAQRMFLAQDLSLSETQVRVWFQNRRIKWRKQMMEKQQGTQFYWKRP